LVFRLPPPLRKRLAAASQCRHISGEGLPSRNHHIYVARFQFHHPRPPSRLLARDLGCSRTPQRIQHDCSRPAAKPNRPFDQFHPLHGGVQVIHPLFTAQEGWLWVNRAWSEPLMLAHSPPSTGVAVVVCTNDENNAFANVRTGETAGTLYRG
jgi:hypothetical protein